MENVAEAIFQTGEVSAHELFCLGGANTGGNWQNGFGLLNDDYSSKAAYETVGRLIATQWDL